MYFFPPPFVDLAEMNERPDQVIINEFGDNLRRIRLEKNLSQEELAHLAEVSTNTISRIELGTNAPGLVMIVRLAEALEVNPGELFP